VRILFCSTAGAGHVGPLVPIARDLAESGHEVLFLLPPGARKLVEQEGFAVSAAPEPEPVATKAIWDTVERDPTTAKVLVNQDYFGRLCTEATLPAAEELCASWQPDLVVHEAAEYASAIAAHRAGIAHVQVAIGLADIEWGGLHAFAGPEIVKFEPDALDVLAASPYLSRLPENLDPSPYPGTIRYQAPEVQPAAGGGGEEHADPGLDFADVDGLADLADLTSDGARLVYATLGSMVGHSGWNWSPGAYRVLLDAFALLQRSNPDVRVLLTVGRKVDPAALGLIPGNTRVVQWFPQDRAFSVASAVVSHGGSGTAYGALSAGLPSVFFPLFADQPYNANLIAGAGAGIQIDTEDLRKHGMPAAAEPAERARLAALAHEVADAMRAVLSDPAYAAKAAELGEQLAGLPPLAEVLGEFLHE
jgi:UDP:flavonoid glycosyltransferase YjiC (YdhE family)